MKRLLCSVLALLLVGASAVASHAEPESAVLRAIPESTIVVEEGRISNVCGHPTAADLIAELDAGEAELSVEGVAADEYVPDGATLICGEDRYTVEIPGDVSPDGRLNAKDVVLILRQCAGTDEISGIASDVNLDGRVNLRDAALLMRYIVGYDVNIGADRFTYDDTPVAAENEDDTVSLFFGDNLTKKDKSDVSVDGAASDLIRMAKNEIEFTQFFLVSEKKREDLTVELGDFISRKGETLPGEVLVEYYFAMEDAATGESVRYADAIIPTEAYPFKMVKDESQGFVIKVKTTVDTPAGFYRARLNVKKGEEIVKCADVYLEVWDFALSDETECATAFGLSRYNIYVTHKQYESDNDVLYRAYYDFLLENRISAYYLPYSVLDDKADEYMSNPRVTSFMIDGRNHPNGDMSDDDLVAAYNKLSKNESWMKKGYFYYVDEPTSSDGVAEVAASANRLAEVFPEYRLTVPYFTNDLGNADLTDALYGAGVNLWTPMSSFWTPLDCTVPGANVKLNETSVSRFGTAEERFANYVKDGDELWWYVCIFPQYPYANFFATYQGALTRVLFWQQYMYNVDGLLYWSVNEWASGGEWRKIDAGFPYGDGRLLYCGQRYGIRGPISSIRLEMVRDGIEDFQYLKMAKERFGDEAVNELLSKVTTGILEYSSDPEVIRQTRNILGEMLAN